MIPNASEDEKCLKVNVCFRKELRIKKNAIKTKRITLSSLFDL